MAKQRVFKQYLLFGGADSHRVFETAISEDKKSAFYIVWHSGEKSWHFQRSVRICGRYFYPRYSWIPLFREGAVKIARIIKDLEPDFETELANIHAYLNSCLVADRITIKLLSHWVLANWFFDLLPCFPILFVQSPSSEVSEQIRKVLSDICFRAIPNFKWNTQKDFYNFINVTSPTIFWQKENLQGMVSCAKTASQNKTWMQAPHFIKRTFASQVIVENNFLLPSELHWHSLTIPIRRVSKIWKEDDVTKLRDRLLTLRLKRYLDIKLNINDALTYLPRAKALTKVLLMVYQPEEMEVATFLGAVSRMQWELGLSHYSYWPKRLARVFIRLAKDYLNKGRRCLSVSYLIKEVSICYPDCPLKPRVFRRYLTDSLFLPIKKNLIYLDSVNLDFLQDKFYPKIKVGKTINPRDEFAKNLLEEIGYYLNEYDNRDQQSSGLSAEEPEGDPVGNTNTCKISNSVSKIAGSEKTKDNKETGG